VPAVHILLVEATTRSSTASVSGEHRGAAGATVVSNSYGAEEFSGVDDVAAQYYTHSGVAIVASTGDYASRRPSSRRRPPAPSRSAAPRYARARHGARMDGNRMGERGIRLLAYFDKRPGKRIRTVRCGPSRTWRRGRSGYRAVRVRHVWAGRLDRRGAPLAAPLIAGVVATADGPAPTGTSIYGPPQRLYDVVGGCQRQLHGLRGDYLCTGLPGYDAPTGLGTRTEHRVLTGWPAG